MANKTQVATVGEQQAAIVINNQFIDGLTKQLEEKCKYGLSFPKDYNLSNALMGAYLVLKETKDKNNNPILESCSQISIANSLMNMATLGLSVQKKQGYFVSYAGQCQFQRSYFGNITIARRYGMKDIHAEIIYQGDKFKYHIEDGNKVLDSHEQDFMNIDNEKILGAYAVVLMEDGTKHLEVMNIKQITGKRKYKVLEQYTEHTKIISLGFVKENVKFDDDTTDYNKSSLKKLCDTEILKDFEEEFGEENIETDISDLITVDGQKIGETECKVRPLTFDEARKYTELTPNDELDDSYWTCSAC